MCCYTCDCMHLYRCAYVFDLLCDERLCVFFYSGVTCHLRETRKTSTVLVQACAHTCVTSLARPVQFVNCNYKEASMASALEIITICHSWPRQTHSSLLVLFTICKQCWYLMNPGACYRPRHVHARDTIPWFFHLHFISSTTFIQIFHINCLFSEMYKYILVDSCFLSTIGF